MHRAAVLQEMKYIDLHCDALTSEGVLQVTKENLRRGGCMLQCFAAFVNVQKCTPAGRFARAVFLCEKFEEMCEKEGYRVVRKFSDIEEGKLNAMLTVEEGGAIEGSLEKLEELYFRGVRMMTLTWNFENEIGAPSPTPPPNKLGEGKVNATPSLCARGENACHPCAKGENELGAPSPTPPPNKLGEGKVNATPNPYAREENACPPCAGGENACPPCARGGLTAFGRSAAERMKELGMIADVSHGSDRLVKDVAEIMRGPFAASHSNARSVFPHPRNLGDREIRLIADSGGVIGLNFFADFLSPDRSAAGQREALLAHAEHIIKVGGEDVLAIGSDFDGIPENPYLKNPSFMPEFIMELQKKFGGDAAEKICRKNVLRVFREVLK